MNTLLEISVSDGLGLISIISAIMAIMVAISIGYNFVAIDKYGKKIDDIEKRFEEKIFEIENRLRDKTESLERQLEKLTELNHNFALVKSKLNDTLGQLDDTEGKYLNALKFLMDNILIISSNPDVFKGEVSGKLEFECYCMAKNLKKFRNDKFVKTKDRSKLFEIKDYWNKRYDEIIQFETSNVIIEKLRIIRCVFNDLIEGLINNDFEYTFSSNDYANLCKLSRD